MLKLQGITKVFVNGRTCVTALRGVGLEAQRGEFISVCGPSGSGKTTLLSIIGCLEMPDGGIYTINGRNALEMKSKERASLRKKEIAFVFQSFNLLPALSAQKNVEMPLLFRGVDAAARSRLASEALESVGMSDRKNHLPGELSGGQQQRVAIARAICADAPLLLADEPTGNLDEASAKSVLSILKNLASQGKTIIMITHDRNLSLETDREIRIENGEILA